MLLTFSLERVAILVIENPRKLWLYSEELLRASEGEETDFILVDEKYNAVSFEKELLIETSIPKLHLNSKKLTNALYKKCTARANEPEYEMNIQKLIAKLYILCKEISLSIGFDTMLKEDCEIIDVFKLFSLSVNEQYPTLLEKLIAYVDICVELLNTKIMVFLFLLKFLEEDELDKFLHHCECCGISILLIEDKWSEKAENLKLRGVIIDNDLCEIER
jgi:CRISPR type II-A-associated protein Csn2